MSLWLWLPRPLLSHDGPAYSRMVAKISILFFAKCRELVKSSKEYLEVPDSISGADLRSLVISTHPKLQVIGKSCVFALNEEYIEDSSLLNLKDGDKLAVVPPISGG